MENSNLVDEVFSKYGPYESCIMFSYGLNLLFFENYLMKLNALGSCNRISIFTDSSTYDNLVFNSYNPRWLNRRYLLTRVKSVGVFHPKLYLFASAERALVCLTSANLTREGIASNLEIFSVFEVSEKKSMHASILNDCIEYARRIAEISKSKNAIEQVEEFRDLCRAYVNNENREIKFIHNLDKPLIEIILQNAKKIDVSKIQILSPFYDRSLSPIRRLKEDFPKCECEVHLQQKKTNFPLENEFSASGLSLFLFKNIERYMHGKAILIHGENEVMIYTGSANCSGSALLEVAATGNYEIGLVGYIGQDTAKGLLCPLGKGSKKIKKIEEIEVSPNQEYEGGIGYIEYLSEATLEGNAIKCIVNEEIPLTRFKPTKYRLINFNKDTYDGIFKKDHPIEVTPSIKSKVPGQMAIQIIGFDEKGNERSSNILWVIELENRVVDPQRKRMRRIYGDPFELMSVLQPGWPPKIPHVWPLENPPPSSCF